MPAIRYEIEWCSSVPEDECGDADIDRRVDEYRQFRTFDEAKASAWKVLRDGAGKLPWEIVVIEKQERQLDEDMLRHENIHSYRWETLERYETTADGEEPYRID